MQHIFYTVIYVAAEAGRYNRMAPVVTLDPSLFLKALGITMNKSNDSSLHYVVVRLGGFHFKTSIRVCIGHLMAGSGLKELPPIRPFIHLCPQFCHAQNDRKSSVTSSQRSFIVDSALSVLVTTAVYLTDLSVNITPPVNILLTKQRMAD